MNLPISPTPDLRVLRPLDQMALADLRREVLATLGDADWYREEDDPDAFIAAHLGKPSGETIGCYDGDELIAYAMIAYPDAPAGQAYAFDELAGVALQRVRPVSRSRIALLASCMVHPSHRGRGLQRKLLAARFALAQSAGREICLAMVSLRNTASRQNLMREGLKILWVGSHHGLQRQVLGIDLVRALRFDAATTQWADSADFGRQQSLVSQGYWGIAEFESEYRQRSTLVFSQLQQADNATLGK